MRRNGGLDPGGVVACNMGRRPMSAWRCSGVGEGGKQMHGVGRPCAEMHHEAVYSSAWTDLRGNVRNCFARQTIGAEMELPVFC